MDFLNDIKEETLIIAPNNIKEKILKEIESMDHLVPFKILSFEDLKHYIYFDYDRKAILFLMEKYGYCYEEAENYIDNMYFVSDKLYKSSKLNFLVNLKKELLLENLITSSQDFISAYRNKKVVVFGYDYISNFNRKILSFFSSYEFIEKKKEVSKVLFYDFYNLEDEVLFVVNKIVSLINNGVNLNDIYILNLDSTYENEVFKVFSMYNIPIDLSLSSSIMSTIMGKDAYEKLEESSFSETLTYIRDKYDLTIEGNSFIYNKIVSIFNNYVGVLNSNKVVIDAIRHDFMNSSVSKNKSENYIHVGGLNNSYFSSSEYVFIIGFNQGAIPKIYKDENFISDSIKEEINLENVNLLNKYEKEATINNILSIKNCFISYKRRYLNDEFYPSNILTEKYFEKGEYKYDLEITYSSCYSTLKLADYIDNMIKYDKIDDNLALYFNSFSIPYLEFDNKYSLINPQLVRDNLKKLVLSYTNLDTFYKCHFRFYLDNILHINKYEETFNTYIGSLFHFVLSKVYKENFDFEREYNYYLTCDGRSFTQKEKFFLDKLKKELIIVCDYLKQFNNMTGLTNVFTEKNISIDKSSVIPVTFKGIVDKIMYKEYGGKTLVSIIDYKTGQADIDIFNANYGIGMQLIIYLYLISKSGLFSNYEIVGFYLQRILSGEVNIDKDYSYIEQKFRNLRLYGYSTDDTLNLERFDTTYENSEYIMSMKYGKSGFSHYSKILNDEEIDNLILLVDKKIDYARDEILNGNFKIDPKWISSDKEVTSCKFCNYKDICFRRNEDIIKLQKNTDLSFLKEGSDNNA